MIANTNLVRKVESWVRFKIFNLFYILINKFNYFEILIFPTKAPLEFCGASSSLCSTIEAIFLHGLKCDSLKAYFSDSDQRRESSFWRFVITFLHKQEIKSIQSLEHVKTNIGYSRVFVRKSLNDSTIFCYFTNITPASCKKYYHDYAFVNDEDLLRKVRKLLIDFDVAFQLPLNSSLLNTYDDGPLILLGIPTSTKRQEVVSIGEDIADGIESSTWYDPSIDDVKESLKFSISVDDDEQFLTTLVIAEYNNTNEQEDEVTENESSTGESESQNNNESGGKSANFDSPKIQLQDDLDDLSFKDLLDEKPDRISLNIAKIRTNISENVKMNCNTNEIQFLEYTGNAKGNRIFQDFQNMVEDLCKLNNQCGLKAQDFLCNGCKMLLGVTISLISVCHFDGHYYCRSCMTIEKFQIPAKIIYNWDFKKYAVSKKAAEFLEDQKSQPLIDLEVSLYIHLDKISKTEIQFTVAVSFHLQLHRAFESSP